MQSALCEYTKGEEICNAVSHGVGIILSVAALSILATFSALYSDAWSIVACSIFGASMTVMYVASTLYHSIPKEGAKRLLKKFDHIAIYYLIAGSYTPFMLGPMRSAEGWTIFGIIWALAILGTVLKLTAKPDGKKWWSVGLYLAMGWLIVLASGGLMDVLDKKAFTFLLLGGLSYTVGVPFYVCKKLKFSHAIWHVFVLGGTVMHFFAVLYACAIG